MRLLKERLQVRYASLRDKSGVYKELFRTWFFSHAQGRHAQAWLFFFSLTEAIFFPFPVDWLLVIMLIANTKRWAYFAFLTTAASVAGGVLGYVVGLLFFGTIGSSLIAFYGLEGTFAKAQTLFAHNAFWAVFIAALTPIPFKVFTLGAGFFKIDFSIFLLASVVGRALRFFGIALVVYLYGALITRFAIRYFNIASVALVAALIVLLLLL